jgi:hypothetical protein
VKTWKENSKGSWVGEFHGHRMSVIGLFADGNNPSSKESTPDFWVYQAGDSRVLYGYPDTTRAMAMEAAEKWASENKTKETP